MGVAGDLQVEPGAGGGHRAAGLVSQKHPQGTCWRAQQGGGRVAAVGSIEMGGMEVGHPGQHQGGGRMVRSVGVQHHMFIEQNRQANAPQLVHPGVGAGVILMVAGDKKGAVARLQPGQRCHVVGQLGH